MGRAEAGRAAVEGVGTGMCATEQVVKAPEMEKAELSVAGVVKSAIGLKVGRAEVDHQIRIQFQVGLRIRSRAALS